MIRSQLPAVVRTKHVVVALQLGLSIVVGIASAATSVLPRWVPAPGYAAVVPTRNTLGSQDPAIGVKDAWWVAQWGGKRNNQILNAWGSSAYAQDLGHYGSIIYAGGGHGDYGGNEVYALDLDSLVYRRLGTVTPVSGTDVREDYQHCEYEYGVPMSSHNYDGLVAIPGALVGGGKGILLRPQSMACGHLARDSGWAHAFDFNTMKWSRWSVNAYGDNRGIGPIFGTALDPMRKRVWEIAMASTSAVTRIGWLDLETRRHGWTTISKSPVVYVDSLCLEYVPSSDIVVGGFMEGPHATHTTLAYFSSKDPASGLRRARLNRSIPAGGPSLAYVGENLRLYAYVKSDPNTLYEIEIPQDPSQTWRVTARRIAGYDMSALSFGSGGMYKKMLYVPRISSLLFSSVSVRISPGAGPVIVYRVPGS